MPLTSPNSGSHSLGRYQIASVLGQGAMGKVYKAFDPLIERTVAVKTIGLHFEGPEIDEFKARFYREAKAAGGLNHPNIVTIYDVAESDNIAYIAMELLDGLSLRQILDAESRPSMGRAARIIAEVADALAYAHDRGVIHRDIKPANILLTRNGLTKITDFGIAQLPATASTQPGLLVGSPRYMAPEQITGTSLDGRADVFSLGAVLYEMLTGVAPFQGQNLPELMYRILHQSPVRASKLVPAIPAALDAIVERALAKNPADRFQSARDLARALRSFEAVPKPVGSLNRKSAANTLADQPAPNKASEAVENIASVPKANIVSRRGRHRKSLAFVSMGLAAGGVFASVAFNQFAPTPIEPLPSKMQSTALNIITMVPSLFASSGAPVQVVVEPEAPPLILAQEAHQVRPAAPAVRSSKAKSASAEGAKGNEVIERLKALQQELMDLKTRFTDLHPDVVQKRRHIERLKEEERRAQERS